ncbi:hypothetical protein SYNPS1DRAFT_31642 [Syncephalis pseudoplumigaleata]|uniref:CCHC-type domain-containing protein n=1 Tax=Syncephalis pseudoplumigaleata TaxID=1712513 RepID=A0A4P9YS87_9FUNG|nr:hypothetical protein SYNPS1DRAFT_31642 [Syncephalis pseudoplumigaleata]|eukprot:RKP22727.1 hypothetical protein SYNPS1DRAFT_31642 [Syncephalis pseudoplumigaleata]
MHDNGNSDPTSPQSPSPATLFTDPFDTEPLLIDLMCELVALRPSQFSTCTEYVTKVAILYGSFPPSYKFPAETVIKIAHQLLPYSIRNQVQIVPGMQLYEWLSAIVKLPEAHIKTHALAFEAWPYDNSQCTSASHTAGVTTTNTFKTTTRHSNACPNCGSTEHRVADQMCCKYCKEPGHTIAQCPQPSCKVSARYRNQQSKPQMHVNNAQSRN